MSITLARKSLVLELNNDCALNDIDIGQEPKVCCQFEEKTMLVTGGNDL